jgi:RNA-directed DNA polymerase
MRAAQFRILTRILNLIEVPEYIYAFEKGRNIPKMAEAHTNKGLVVSIDLKDFFGSIKQHHLFELFTNLGFEEAPARTLSELCTYKSFVPQGALTSPKVSNLITMSTFGPALLQYCEQHGYSLTVYADDVTISCEEDLVKQSGYDAAFEIVRFVSQLVSQYGFRVNREKTKVMRPYQRQYVCGAVVNSKVNLQKTERNRLRAIVHNIRTNGLEAEAAKSNLPADRFYAKLMGQLNWFGQLNPEAGASLKSSLKQIVLELGEPYVEGGDVKEEASSDTQQKEA